MSKWELRVEKHETGGYISLFAVKGERTRSLWRIYPRGVRSIDEAAREALDTILQLNASDVTPVTALEARFWAAVERVKQSKPDLAECVCRDISQQAELLRGVMNEARLDECQRFLSLRDGLPGSTLLSEMYDSVRRRIRELEAEGEST